MSRTTDDLLHFAVQALMHGGYEPPRDVPPQHHVCLVFDFAEGEWREEPLVGLGDLGERGTRSLVERARKRPRSSLGEPMTIVSVHSQLAIRVLADALPNGSMILRLLDRPAPDGTVRVVVVLGRTVALCTVCLFGRRGELPLGASFGSSLGAVILEMTGQPCDLALAGEKN